MDPPTPGETLAQGLPIFDEGDEINEGIMRDDVGAPLKVEVDLDFVKNDSANRKHKKKKKKQSKNLRLAKRTSKILANYRAFLQENDLESQKDAFSDLPEEGLRNSHYYEHKAKDFSVSSHQSNGKNLASSNHSDDGNTCLLRDFTMTDVPLGSSGDGPKERKYKVPPTVLRSKRVKYGVLMSFGLLLVFVIAIGATARGSKKAKLPTRDNTPGWHNEAAYILEHEHGDMNKKLPHYDIIVPMEEESHSEPMQLSDVPTSHILEPLIENDAAEQSFGADTEVKATTTENEAESKVEPESIMVPKEKSHSESRVEPEPTSESRVEPESTMVSVEESQSEPMQVKDVPTSHIIEPLMKNDATEENVGAETEEKVAQTENEVESKVKQDSIKEGQETELAPTELEQEPMNEQMQAAGVAAFELVKILHNKFKPLWLGPGEGWTGGSHDEAMQYCRNIRGKELCPYSAMCPLGPGRNVMAGRRPVDFSSHGEQYAPVYGEANRWVMVGQKNGDPSTTCMSHEQLERRPPSWGVNGDMADMKKYIMCCSVPQEFNV
mmetsp:Transcript_11534/g.24592  ORF Transcript_11534/g.24592 Transcript_11534/m.24592 type:complete len:551 (+) Transcript_11534:238-1890(+)|eukprot:CAMPEP_0183718634 /NCGR_PEP_ID=MMETSP0737-20130205/11844_1 /TAXON_ID=385413 /ORGANISM="Thalassiosira miniscula, Strain CCMP1093" /LENGTH=550 /DNA_ID=CAMNT_0025948227 /DNA_START=226 /DNA_END=1878 /DNA_ORIENTATION=-